MADEINGKLDEIMDAVKDNSEKLENIEVILIGSLEDSDKIGLVTRVRKLEKWYSEVRDDLTWIKRAFIGGMITIIASGIIIIIQNSFN
jgi:hypothetical protein